jgi:Protein of unknown function (DUF4199)
MKLNVLGGLAVASIALAVLLGLHISGSLRSPDAGSIFFLTIAGHAVVLIVVLRRHHLKLAPEQASFFRLLGAGLLLSLIAGLLIALGSYLFAARVDPTYLDWLLEVSREQIAAAGLPAEAAQNELERLQGFATPRGYALQSLIGALSTGFVLTLLISVILRLRALRQDGP